MEMLVHLLYPDRCPGCGKVCEGGGMCESCLPQVRFAEEPLCFGCGKPLEHEEEEYCADCRRYVHSFTCGRGGFLYEDPVKESIHKIKYRNKREYLEYFGKELSERLGGKIREWDPEVLIPVPMYPADRRKRGYNQSECLAGIMEEELEIPVFANAVKKVQKTRNQKELSPQMRRKNLSQAFVINPDILTAEGALPWKRILVVDDVYTTGSTVDAMAEVLKQYGAEKVYFAVICIGKGDS